MAIDEATAGFLAQMAAQGGPPLHELAPADARQMIAMLTQLSGPGPDVASVSDHTLSTPDGGSFAIRVLTPELPKAVVVYYHGGGWVLGDIPQVDNLGRQLALRTDSTVVLVDYRLAPEHRYPIAVEDAWQALTWVEENLDSIAGGTVPIIVAGDSAGGNLAAIVAQRSRDRSGPPVALQVLIYPVTDADLNTPSYLAAENQLMLSKDSMIWFWDHYADESRRAEPDASPLRATDLSGLPPAVVLIAEHDVLRSEGEAYAEALESAGVSVRQRLFEGQMHGFFTMVNILPGAAAGLDYVADAINASIAPQSANL
ncbi:alpha/beta hydrolase [Microbacterium sp. No. 7]|uniref:alpha/beta hydrolase n=1 Tax=Microbacterium sp. No. 7 TaxID=1714373 RepID=UPI0006D2C854|nr:alpha/beta hydrolase [Microbacterium sp. No. 7]ALJ20458.1 esterase [Microbacterium sp. No. 7]